MPRITITPRRAAVAAVLILGLWQAALFALVKLDRHREAATADFGGWVVVYAVGLVAAVWGLERVAQRIERRRMAAHDAIDGLHATITPAVRPASVVWNPLDPAAWYWGRGGPRLRQSLAALGAYSLFILLAYWLAHMVGPASAVEPYELPAGGGQEMMAPQQVQIRKVVRKKYVINPYSTIKFAPPPIDQVDVKLQEETRNEYKVGQGADGAGAVGDGDGDGAGFGKGTGKGKVRLIRLRHSDRGWDKNFGIGGDKNMLAEYGARTRQKIADETEAIEVAQLAAFPPNKAPPVVYVGGTAQFSLSAADKKILAQYLTERHGMVFGDNLGGPGFHHHFVATMNEVTGTTPVPIPRDDRIHQSPYRLPDLPIVVAHGGTVPLGWKIDGRWAVYYHPGALSDAWRDDHAGIKKDIYEMCYQLGTNVIFYAHREYNQWLKSQQP